MSKLNKFSREEFERICRESKSYRDFASNLGCSKDSGTVNAAIKARLKEYGITPTWFTGQGWCKGLTKETDDRVAKFTKTLKDGYDSGRITPSFLGRHHSEGSKNVMSEKARYNAEHHINGWKAGNSKAPNKYELQTREYLSSLGITYEPEKTISKKTLGLNEPGLYNLDFLIDGVLDLEIDGSSHNTDNIKQHDEKRDAALMSNGYEVYRIKTYDSQDILAKELEKFLQIYLSRTS